MDREEFLNILKELETSLKVKEACNDEITRWRERFLASLTKYENIEKAAYVWHVFLSTPSSEMPRDLDKYIKDLEKQYDLSNE